jgi:hypothetical protein
MPLPFLFYITFRTKGGKCFSKQKVVRRGMVATTQLSVLPTTGKKKELSGSTQRAFSVTYLA